MAITPYPAPRRPRVAVTLGDQAGVGPELIAKLLSQPGNLQKADVLVMADREEFDAARADAGGVEIPISKVAGPSSVQIMHDNSMPRTNSSRSEVHGENGERCIHQLRRSLDLWRAGEVDAIVFGPLNKSSLKKAGMTEEDELRWFAKELDFKGSTSEINIAGPLWTARVTSHVGVEKVAGLVTRDATLKAIELLHRLRSVFSVAPRASG
jgi:4-hydroxy-L-threonine phosphate dehydrogenase PdxA